MKTVAKRTPNVIILCVHGREALGSGKDKDNRASLSLDHSSAVQCKVPEEFASKALWMGVTNTTTPLHTSSVTEAIKHFLKQPDFVGVYLVF